MANQSEHGVTKSGYWVIGITASGQLAAFDWLRFNDILICPLQDSHQSWLERIFGPTAQFRYWGHPRSFMKVGESAQFTPEDVEQNLAQWLSQGGKEEAARMTETAEPEPAF